MEKKKIVNQAIVPETNYTKIPNEIWGLKLKASDVVLYCYLLSCKDGFRITKSFIMSNLGWNRNYLNRCFGRLSKLNLIKEVNDEIIIKGLQNVSLQNVSVQNVSVQNVSVEGDKMYHSGGTNCNPNNTINKTNGQENKTKEGGIQNVSGGENHLPDVFVPSLAFAKITHPNVELIFKGLVELQPKLDNPKFYNRFNQYLFYVVFLINKCNDRIDVIDILKELDEKQVKQYSKEVLGFINEIRSDSDKSDIFKEDFKKVIDKHYKEFTYKD